jgi:hypothetical protein
MRRVWAALLLGIMLPGIMMVGGGTDASAARRTASLIGTWCSDAGSRYRIDGTTVEIRRADQVAVDQVELRGASPSAQPSQVYITFRAGGLLYQGIFKLLGRNEGTVEDTGYVSGEKTVAMLRRCAE